VQHFTYLGLKIDQQARSGTIVADLLSRASGALGMLCEFIGTQRWTVPWTRLVLYDVYVRTLLTYGAPIWTPHYLAGVADPQSRTPLG
jgi:hypothetical protein